VQVCSVELGFRGGGGVVLARIEAVQHAVQGLHVGDVAADADYCLLVEGKEAFHIGEAGEGTVGCCWGEALAVEREGMVGNREKEVGDIDEPRLSAAMTTPSLNLTPITDVPVTAGDCVCCVGPVVWR